MKLFYQNKISKKILLPTFLMVIFCFFQTPKTQAAWIPGLDPAIRTGLDEVMGMINGLITGTLKQQAVLSLNSQVDNLAGNGAGGQATFITNWQDYLINQPSKETNVYMNDYLSKMTRGRNTYSGYSTDGFGNDSQGNAGNYSADLSQTVQAQDSDVPRLSYEGSPSQMFDNGNLKNMELYLSGVNNAWGFSIAYNSKKQKTLENLRFVAQTKSISNQGFVGTTDSTSGSVISPGILTKEMMANVQNMPNNVLANAQSIPEVISSIVSQMINRSITQGFSSVQRKISRATSSNDKVTSSINKAIEKAGPQARFDN